MIETDSLLQPYEVDDLARRDVLLMLRDSEVQARQADRRKLRLAAQWCVLNPGTVEDHAGLADVEAHPFDLPDVHIAGEGTPWVAAGAPEAFAAALGLSPQGGQSVLADALDLTHRLREIWRGVDTLAIPVWKARKVARMTRVLPVEAAAWVDAELAPRLAAGLGILTIERTVMAAMAAFCPELLEERQQAGKAAWRVTIDDRRDGGWDGTSVLDALGDTADLHDFHDLVCAVAERLAEQGDTDAVGQRRAKALGLIGRGEHVALLESAEADAEGGAGAGAEVVRVSSRLAPRSPGRRVPRRLFVHVRPTDLRGTVGFDDPNAPDGPGGLQAAVAPVSVEQLGVATASWVRSWLGSDALLHVTPVVDLNRADAVDRHDPPAWMREQVIQRDPHCVHPYCAVDARLCDLDHIEPYRPHGPPGQTRPENLAPLCRTAHLAKTHLGWSYLRNDDGTYTWTDPSGLRYLVTPDGTFPLG